MIFACPAVASLAGPPGDIIIVDQPPNPITVITLLSDRVDTSYSPPSDFAGYHFRYATSAGLAWAAMTDVDPLGIRASGFVLLTGLPAAAVEVAVRPQDLAGHEGTPEARQLLNVTPPVGIELAPVYTHAWLGMKTDAAAAWTQHATDLEMVGGAVGGSTAYVGVVSLLQYTVPCTVELDYVHAVADTNADPAGVFAQIDFYWLAGAVPNVASLGTAVVPTDGVLQGLGVRGLRASLDTKNSASATLTDKVRWRALTDAGVSAANLALAVRETLQTFAFPPGGKAHVTITVPGDGTLRLDVDWPDLTTTTQRWADALVDAWLPSGKSFNILLVNSGGRDASWSNVVHKKLTIIQPGGSEGVAPPFPQPASAANVIKATAANFTAQYATAGPGDTVLVAPGFSYSGNLTLGRNGSKGSSADNRRPDSPVIVRVGTLAADGKTITDPSSFPAATVTGSVNGNGDYCWLRGFTVKGGVDVPKGTLGFRFNRCYFTLGGCGNKGTDTSFDWCEFYDIRSEFLQHIPSQGALRPFTYRCWHHHQQPIPGPVGTFESIGVSNPDDAFACRALIYENLYGPGGDAGEGAEMKSSYNIVYRCATVGPGTGTDKCPRNVVRHGTDNLVLANWSEGPGQQGCVGARGPRNIMADCVSTGGATIGPFEGNCTYAEWLHFVTLNQQSGKYPSGDDCIVCRVKDPYIGQSPAGTGTPPKGTILEDCTGTVGGPAAAAVTTRHNTTDYYTPNGLPSPTANPARKWPVPTGKGDKVGPNGAWDPSD